MKKFDVDSYRAEINAEIAGLKAAKKAEKDWYKRSRLQDKIESAELRLNPKWMCKLYWSDRHAYEVIRIETAKRMVVRRLIAERCDDGPYMSDAQGYKFRKNKKAPEVVVRMHKNGLWYEAGDSTPFCLTSEPHEYFDFSF